VNRVRLVDSSDQGVHLVSITVLRQRFGLSDGDATLDL
jgi:hypothetical protein